MGDETLVHFFPQNFYDALGFNARFAEGMAWHFLFMWLFAINGVCYVLYTLISGEWRYLLPNRNTLREAIQVASIQIKLFTRASPISDASNGRPLGSQCKRLLL